VAIAFRSASTASGTGASSGTINKPAGAVDNDCLVLVTVLTGGTLNSASVSGFVTIATYDIGTSLVVQVHRRIASGEPGSYSIAFVSSGNYAAVMCAYSGVDTSNPVDVLGGWNNGSTANPVRALSLTTTNNGDQILWCAGQSASGATPFTAPSGETKRGEDGVMGSYAVIADENQGSAGATGNKDGISSSSGSWAAVLVSLNPALAGSPPVFFGGMVDDRIPRRPALPARTEIVENVLPITGLVTDINRLPAPDMSLARCNRRLPTPEVDAFFYSPLPPPPQSFPFYDLYPLPRRLRPLPFDAWKYPILVTAEESRLAEWAPLFAQPRRPAVKALPGLGEPYSFPQPPALALTWSPEVSQPPRRRPAVGGSFTVAPVQPDSLAVDGAAGAEWSETFRLPPRPARGDFQPPQTQQPDVANFGPWIYAVEGTPRRPGRAGHDNYRGPALILPTEAGMDWQQGFVPVPRRPSPAGRPLTAEAQALQFWTLTPDVLITWARPPDVPTRPPQRSAPSQAPLNPVPSTGDGIAGALFVTDSTFIRPRTPEIVRPFWLGPPARALGVFVIAGPYLVVSMDVWFAGADQGDAQTE